MLITTIDVTLGQAVHAITSWQYALCGQETDRSDREDMPASPEPDRAAHEAKDSEASLGRSEPILHHLLHPPACSWQPSEAQQLQTMLGVFL